MIHGFQKTLTFCKTALKIIDVMINKGLGQVTENLWNFVTRALIKTITGTLEIN